MNMKQVFSFILASVWFTTALCAPIRKSVETEEATKIALESTGELLAQPSLIKKIQADLELIRYLDPAMRDVVHQGQWMPGELISSDITESQIMEINNSEFKPIKKVDLSSQSPNTLLVFKKAYHPERLANLLKLRFGINAQPNFIESSSSDTILYSDELSTYYFNSKNGMDCENDCLAQYSVSFNPQDFEENKV